MNETATTETTASVQNAQAADTATATASATGTAAAVTTATVTIPATQSRWKSWTMWASVAGALWVIFNAVGLPAKLGFSADTYNTILNAAGTILIALGIVNNPTSSTNL